MLIERRLMTDSRDLARAFKVLSVDARVRIVQLLKERSMCVNVLAAKLAMTPAAVSQHLRVLRDGGVVLDSKSGNFVHYRLNPDTLLTWRTMTTSLLDCGTPEDCCAAGMKGKCGG